jgi:hypothetical protein
MSAVCEAGVEAELDAWELLCMARTCMGDG